MHHTHELIRLGSHKVSLRRRISLRRESRAELVARLLQSTSWLERMVAFSQKLSPLIAFAMMPIALRIQRRFFQNWKTLGTLIRWTPVVWSTLRRFR